MPKALSAAHGLRRSVLATAIFVSCHVGAEVADAGSSPSLSNTEAASASTQLLLRNGAFDPLTQNISAKSMGVAEVRESRYGIVQFHSAEAMNAQALRERGADVVGYLPHNAYVVRWKNGSPDVMAKSSDVRWAGPFQPAYKVAPVLWRDVEAKSADSFDLEIMGFAGEDEHRLIKHLQKVAPGIQVIHSDTIRDVPFIHVSLNGLSAVSFAQKAAQIDAVMWVDKFRTMRLLNRDTVGPIQGNQSSGGFQTTFHPIWDQDLIGTNQIVAVADSGLDRNATAFRRWTNANGDAPDLVTNAEETPNFEVGQTYPNRKVFAYFVMPGASAYDDDETCPDGTPSGFHGTHVTGTVAADVGDPATRTEPNYDDGDGMAPQAQILFQDLGNDETGCLSGIGGYRMFMQAHEAGAHISSNSYGGEPADAADDAYFSNDFQADAAAYDAEDMLLVFAAGNATASGIISHPGQAKNVLTVGASAHGEIATVAGYSSGGTTSDGRLKPDVLAPGTGIRSVGGDDDDNGKPSLDNPVVPKNGTSMATPAVAGGAAMMRQYYMEGFYPSGVRTADDENIPSGMLMKATLLNGTFLFDGSPEPETAAGWGRIFLDNNLYFDGDSRSLRFWDVPNGLGLTTGSREEFTVAVNEGEEFRATLTWFDPPGITNANQALINDLDLEVEFEGEIYKGNRVVNGASVSGGARDAIDTVEQVILPDPAPGEYTVRVKGKSVPGTGALNTDRQGFALVTSQAQCATGVLESPDVNVNAGENDINLDFDLIAGATSYQVYRTLGSCSNNNGAFRFAGSASSGTFADSLTQGGFEYAYRVRGVDACGEGPWGACQSVVSKAACNLEPQFEEATVSVSSVGGDTCGAVLSWTAGESECPGVGMQYNVYRSQDPVFTPSSENLIAAGIQGTSYTDFALQPLETYFYIVLAEDKTNRGDGPNNGNETFDFERVQITATAESTSPGTFNDDPDQVSFANIESLWQISDRRAATGSLSYRNAGDGANLYPAQTCGRMSTPAIPLQASGSPQLSFDAWFDIEADWDGVVVEISTDGGETWQDLPPNGGYPGDFSMTEPEGIPINECGYPKEQGAFNGSQRSFQTYTADLSAFAGQTVQVRWSFSSDPGSEFEGFYLDNINITEASVPNACEVASITSAVSGPWFNSEQSGHGWLIELLEQGDQDLVNAYWYVYQDGNPVWLIGTGPVEGSSATLDVLMPTGGDFPPNFDSADLDLTEWGTLTFDFNGDGTGSASWNSVISGFGSGSIAMNQIAPLSTSAASCRSGSYFNPDQSGHGFVAEVINVEGQDTVILAWYVYQDGEQVWLFGQGALNGDTAVVNLQQFSGADFPPNFVASEVNAIDWGTATMTFNSDGTATVDWDAQVAGYADGSLELTRLTVLKDKACN